MDHNFSANQINKTDSVRCLRIEQMTNMETTVTSITTGFYKFLARYSGMYFKFI